MRLNAPLITPVALRDWVESVTVQVWEAPRATAVLMVWVAEPELTVTPVLGEVGVMVRVLVPPMPTAAVALLPKVRVLIVVSAPRVVLEKLLASTALKITSVAALTGRVAGVVPARSSVKLLRLAFQTELVEPFQ